MIEVEETSDFIRLMLQGVQGRSQPALDNLYRKHEEVFPYQAEVTRRFHVVMDKIDGSLGGDLSSMAFSRRGLFETLFTFYYDLLFSLKSPLKRVKVKVLPSTAAIAIRRASDRIISGDLSEELAKVLRGATGNKGSREIRLKFLQGIFGRVKS